MKYVKQIGIILGVTLAGEASATFFRFQYRQAYTAFF